MGTFKLRREITSAILAAHEDHGYATFSEDLRKIASIIVERTKKNRMKTYPLTIFIKICGTSAGKGGWPVLDDILIHELVLDTSGLQGDLPSDHALFYDTGRQWREENRGRIIVSGYIAGIIMGGDNGKTPILNISGVTVSCKKGGSIDFRIKLMPCHRIHLEYLDERISTGSTKELMEAATIEPILEFMKGALGKKRSITLLGVLLERIISTIGVWWAVFRLHILGPRIIK